MTRLLPWTILAFAFVHAAAQQPSLRKSLDAEITACDGGSCGFAASLAAIEQELRAKPSSSRRAELAETQSYIRLRQGRAADALAAADASIAADPRNLPAYMYKAYALHALGRVDEATAAARAEIAMATTAEQRALATCHLATVYVKSSRWLDAVAALPRGAFRDEAIGACVRDVGTTLDSNKQFDPAADAYWEAAKTLRQDPDPRLRAMYLFALQDRRKEAADAISEFLKSDLVPPAGYESMFGFALSRAVPVQQALAIMKDYLARRPNDEWAWVAVAQVHTSQQNAPAAEAIYEALYRKSPGNARKYVDPLVIAYLVQQKAPQARALCENSIALEDGLGLGFVMRCAEAYRLTRACDKAVPRFDKVLRGPEKSLVPTSAFGAGMCLEQGNDLQGALARYKLASQDPRIAPRIRIVTDKLGKSASQ